MFADDEEVGLEESMVGGWADVALREELNVEELDTERRLVFGDAERGRFLSLLKFDIPLGLRAVVVVGEADLRVSVVFEPSAFPEDVFEEVAFAAEEVDGCVVEAAEVAGRVDLVPGSVDAVFVDVELLLSLPLADAGLDTPAA